jgi:hypothetical protein
MKSLRLLILLMFFGAGDLSGQLLTGRVVSAETQEGIENAFVELLDADVERLAGVFTDRSGRFRVQVPVPTDSLTLVAGAIGYGSGSWAVPEAQENATIDLGTLELEIAPIALSPLELQVNRSRLTPGSEWVRRRQLLGKGRFFSGAVLGVLEPRSLSFYLAEETEMRVSYDMRGVPFLYNPAADCTLVFVNEWPMNAGVTAGIPRPLIGVESIDRIPISTSLEDQYLGFASLDHIPLERIAAIEVYEEMRDVPPGRLQFSTTGAHPCAIVNVWTWDSW